MDSRIPVLAVALVVVASGCSFLGGQSPEQEFRDLASKAETSTFHVTYSMSLGSSDALSGLIGDIEYYSYEGRTKMLTTFSLLGSTTIAVYDFNNRTVTCTETSSSFGETGLECELGERETFSETGSFTDAERYEEELDNITIRSAGTKTVAGRSCRMFTMHMPSDVLNSSYYEGGADAGICLDEEKGYVALLSINTTRQSELAGNTTQNVLRMKVESHSSDVSASDVEIPVNAVVKARCDPFKAQVTSLTYDGPAKLSVNDDNQTVSLTAGETTNVTLSDSQKVDGDNQMVVYAGGSKSSSSCWDYGFDYDYDYNDTDYDYNFSDY